MPITRTEALSRLHTTIASGKAIVGAGSGTGLAAKSLAAGGIDLLILYNSGYFRSAGLGSLAGLLPLGDANTLLLSMSTSILPAAPTTPILAGVFAGDPFRSIPRFLRELQELGFCGIQNFPTVGLYDGKFRAGLEETGFGYDKEVEMIREAHRVGLLTAPYVFDSAQAVKMAEAGADIVVVHLGLTMRGMVGGASGVGLEEAVGVVQEIADAASGVRREGLGEVIVLVHGGPVAERGDAEYLLQRVRGVKGFFGASSLERLPVEVAVAEAARGFKEIEIPK